MKKTAFALILFLMLFILVFGVQAVNVVKAVNILSPTNSTYPAGSPLSLNVSGPNLGVMNILMTYSIDGQGNVSIPLVFQPAFPGQLSFNYIVTGSVILPELPEGPHNITVYEIPPLTPLDNATAYFIIDDGKPPIITIHSPGNKTYSQNTIPLNFIVDEPTSWIGYCLDGHDNVTVAGNTTLPNLSSQNHSLTVYAQDLAGNIDSETVNFTIFPTALVTTSIVVVAVITICAGLLVYFKKRKHKEENLIGINQI
jgi:hypothetical protein